MAIILLAAFGATAASAGAVPLPPDDPFYAPPPRLATQKPGTILRSREVSVPNVDNDAKAYQLLYRTTGAKGEPIATVTTLFLPKEPAPGPRRLVSFFPASDSLSMTCSPSYTLRSGTGQTGPGLGNTGESSDVNSFLGYGWDLAVPDYEGPDSQWVAGPLAGYTALDGMRAVEHFKPAGLDGRRTKLGMGGYSGGSIPTLWAASLAKSYAPELRIVAAVSGGNLPNPKVALAPLDGSPLFGTVIGVSVGIDRAFPELRLNDILNDKGRALAARDAVDAGGCGGSVTSAPGGTVAEYSNYPTPEAILAIPRLQTVFARLNLIGRAAPGTPSLIFNSAQDELTPTAPVTELVAADCAQGAIVNYSNPPGDHVTGSALLGQNVVPYLTDRFAGVPPPNTCPAPLRKRPPRPRRTRVKRRGRAFRFSATGAVTEFQCRLSRRHGRASVPFTLCTSPTRYTHLKPGRYVLAVRAVNAAGADPRPATARFAI